MTGILEMFADLSGDDWEQLAFVFPMYARELKRRDHWLRREFASRSVAAGRRVRVQRTTKAAKKRDENRLHRQADPAKYREQSRRYSAAYRARRAAAKRAA